MTSKKEIFELFETMIKKPFGTKNSSKDSTVNGTKSSKGSTINGTKYSKDSTVDGTKNSSKRFDCKWN